jgi:YVTN family beta-propeller protein
MRTEASRHQCLGLDIIILLGIVMVGCSGGGGESGGSSGSEVPASQNPQTPTAFVNNTGDTPPTLSVVRLGGAATQSLVGQAVTGQQVSKIGANNEFGGNAIGDMQFSVGEWIFANISAANGVALIDPLFGATPVFEKILPTGERPVHIYRDSTDGEVIWSMNDGNVTTRLDSLNCQTGGSVSAIHNSHLGPGGQVPFLLKTICLGSASGGGKGHKVAAFSTNNPKRTFITNEVSGDMTVINNDQGAGNAYLTVIARIDLCDSAKEQALNPPQPACDTDVATDNHSSPHGIRWSEFAKKIYSIQVGYRNIIEVDPGFNINNPASAITRKVDLPAPFTTYGIDPTGRFLIVRGVDLTTDPNHVIGKLGVIDVNANPLAVVPFTIPQLQDVRIGSFKFSKDGKKLFLTQSNSTTGGLTANQIANLKKDKIIVLDTSSLPNTPVAVAEISLLQADSHSADVLVQSSGEAGYLVISNRNANSVSIIDAKTNQLVNTVPVGNLPGAVMVYYPGAAGSNNVAVQSVVSSGQSAQQEMLSMPQEPELSGDGALRD